MFIKPTRRIEKVFLHCSDSDVAKHDNIETIKEWHLKRGFTDIGYHYVILKDGSICIGRDIEKIPASQKGYNTNTIAICLTGSKKFSKKQFESLKQLCEAIKQEYNDKITFHGHCEVSNKSCPVFDYKKVLNLDKQGYIKLINLKTSMNWKKMISKVAPNIGQALTNPVGFLAEQATSYIKDALNLDNKASEKEVAKQVSALSKNELSLKLKDKEIRMKELINEAKKLEIKEMEIDQDNYNTAIENFGSDVDTKHFLHILGYLIIGFLGFVYLGELLLSIFGKKFNGDFTADIVKISEYTLTTIIGYFTGKIVKKNKQK